MDSQPETDQNGFKEIEDPLVSIIVITYNSGKYILETLESAKVQSYQNIELIVSDDSSTDNTVAQCRKWIKTNKPRFVRSELITFPDNKGISVNCNRGISVAKGAWIKLIAGDDLLLPNCISSYIEYIKKNPEFNLVFCKIKLLGEFANTKRNSFWEESYKKFDDLTTPEMQYKELKYLKNFVPAAGSFFRKNIWEEVGGFDEDILLLEDRPFWIRCTSKGHKLFLIDAYLVKYRMSESTVQLSNRMKIAYSIFNLKYVYDYRILGKIFSKCYKQLKEKNLLNNCIFFAYLLFFKIFLNNKQQHLFLEKD